MKGSADGACVPQRGSRMAVGCFRDGRPMLLIIEPLGFEHVIEPGQEVVINTDSPEPPCVFWDPEALVVDLSTATRWSITDRSGRVVLSL